MDFEKFVKNIEPLDALRISDSHVKGGENNKQWNVFHMCNISMHNDSHGNHFHSKQTTPKSIAQLFPLAKLGNKCICAPAQNHWTQPIT